PLRCAPLAWRHDPPWIELIGVDRVGSVAAAKLFLGDGAVERVVSQAAPTAGGYRAATGSGGGMVVAVSPARGDWLSPGSDRFRRIHSLKVDLSEAVACFPAAAPHEVLVVAADGFIARVAPTWRVGQASGPT